ncbi:unnamed protein product [Clonostachys rosea]|uniref:Uncharacterized protein n=1 Tax=Bionectria ochroleuca TaxID=29856 RepID=A0ABY6ULM5_BIOOC|nr:unnamed protein product [Clonostachys rosea]
MRYSTVFFAALLGSTAAIHVGELQDRDTQEISERDLFEDDISTLQERAAIKRPPGWKGMAVPIVKNPPVLTGRPSRSARPRDLGELGERDFAEDSFSALHERAPFKPVGFKDRLSRRNRLRGLGELEQRVLQRRALPGSRPRHTGSDLPPVNRLYKGLAPPGRRPRDVEEFDERDLYNEEGFDLEE